MQSNFSLAISTLLKNVPAQMPPATMLYSLVATAGWRVCEGPVPGRRLAMCDAWTKTIWVDTRFRQALKCPHREGQLRTQRVAHEFGHAFLHANKIRQGERTQSMEYQANVFSQRLLLPPAWVRSTTEVGQMAEVPTTRQKYLWRLVLDLADAWGCTGAFTAQALHDYRFIKLDHRTRQIGRAA